MTLQGSVESFSLTISGDENQTVELPPDAVTYTLEELIPNTNYTFAITVMVNGGLSVTSLPVLGRTADGGMLLH